MEIDKLKTFYKKAFSKTWGSSDDDDKYLKKEEDGSITYLYEEGDLKFHDNYFGGEPYGGRIVISKKNKPIWMMVYYGLVYDSARPETIYSILRNSFKSKEIPSDLPIRGPIKYTSGKNKYINCYEGDMELFSGSELIYMDNVEVYTANFSGGLVNRGN